NEEFRKHQRVAIQKSLVFKDLGPMATEEGEVPLSLRGQFNMMVEQSGLTLTPERLMAYMAAGAVIAGALGGLLRQNILVGMVAACVGAAIPYFYVLLNRN